MDILSLLLLGIIAGTVAGLLGVGGGIVIVPMLVWIFGPFPEIPAASLMHIAIGTSLATIVITSVSSIIAHQRHKAVQWSIVWRLTPGIIIGAALGAIFADMLPSDTLRIIFALFILFVSVQLSVSTQFAPLRQLPSDLAIGIMGIVIGSISALVGIGGGSLTVPFLLACRVPIRNAIGTSAACGFPIAVSGTIGFIITGWEMTELPALTGYIYWPAVFAIVPTSLLFAQLGAKLAHIVPVNILKKFFAVFLAVVGLKMLL
ncbi:sulfite exporter TauE/SafE family protein [Candidatus Marithioploca araucensis]|uniref:Probable membrane transporter protein n=1 Tax=Candidatus Marithioploca araucensis TaxID=70273 RepID=A0ABT7VS66_9GAMM|nr:sulfite exporter TauE/SafE family protein [Candidatus Marithioploca araucensis]